MTQKHSRRRRDYINIQRKLIKELRENHINMQIPYYPDLKLTNQQLATKLGVNERTIRRHKKNISNRIWQRIESETIWDMWHRLYD